MTLFLLGVAAMLSVGVIGALIIDSDVREAVLTIGYAALIGAPLLLWMCVAALLRLLPAPIQPRMVRGRTLSTRALRRVAERAHLDGWMVSTRSTSIVVLKRKKD